MTIMNKDFYNQHCDNLHKVLHRTKIQLGYGVRRVTKEFPNGFVSMMNEQ